jgi:ABC-type proline/glycine betaine transport system ATPase subunit
MEVTDLMTESSVSRIVFEEIIEGKVDASRFTASALERVGRHGQPGNTRHRKDLQAREIRGARTRRGVNLSSEGHEIIGIVGPSGSGKSTLLHILGGIDLPTAGTVLLDGRDLSSLSEEERSTLRRREIGFIFSPSTSSPS